MSEQIEQAADGQRPPAGSAGDGGTVEAAGTYGGLTADADGEIVLAHHDVTVAHSPMAEVSGGDLAPPDAAGTDMDAPIGGDRDGGDVASGGIRGYEDLESDPGV